MKESSNLLHLVKDDLEHHLLAVRRYLTFTDLEKVDLGLRRSFKKLAKSFLVLNNNLFKRTVLGPKIVVERKNHVVTLKLFQNQIRHGMPKQPDSSLRGGSCSHQLVPT